MAFDWTSLYDPWAGFKATERVGHRVFGATAWPAIGAAALSTIPYVGPGVAGVYLANERTNQREAAMSSISVASSEAAQNPVAFNEDVALSQNYTAEILAGSAQGILPFLVIAGIAALIIWKK